MSLSSFLSSGKEKKKTQEEKLSLAHEFLARYSVIKVHSWRGKLKRVICIGKHTVATIDPTALFKLTNEWQYGTEFFDTLPKTGTQLEFTITVGKGKSSETMTFSTPDRAEILTEIQRQRKKFAARDTHVGQVFGGKKLRWNEEWKPASFSLAAHGLQQVDPHDSTKVIGCYEYWLIKEIGTMSDTPGGVFIKYSDHERIHVYQSDRSDELIRRILETASKYIGFTDIRTGNTMTMTNFEQARLGAVPLEELVSASEFSVAKVTPRHAVPVRRQLCITDKHLVERDPATYNVVTARPLIAIFALIRCEEDSQSFNIEYKDNVVKSYTSTDRDSLLASLLDGVRRAGNLHCCIKMSKTDRGHRTGAIRKPVPEMIESTLLKVMGEYDVKPERDIITYPQLIRYFNNNIEYSGLYFTETKDALFAENKEKMIATAITALLVHSSDSPSPEQAADQFYALRRLAASHTGFEAFTKIPGFVRKVGKSVVTALKMRHDAVSHAAIDFLAALLYPMHDKYDIFQEQANRRSLLASQQFLSNLVALLKQHALANTGALVLSSLLDFFVFALCPPYSDTTDSGHFNTIIELLAEGAGPAMFRLYLHPCMALGIASGMLMKTIVQECDSQAKRLQRYALSEGTLLRQFYLAMWSKNHDQRELAVELIGLWTVDCPEAQELLKRMVPHALLSFLQSKEKLPNASFSGNDSTGIASSHWRIKMGVPTPQPQPPEQQPVTLRKAKQLVSVTLNWQYFFHIMHQDHTRPDVIWNHHTREELRECVERELSLLSQGTDVRRGHEVAWNHVEFEVLYECLKDEIQIGSHFLRLLLEDPNPQIHNPREFFYDLYHRFLLVSDVNLKAQCMHGMARLYETHASEIGVFNDLSFIVAMLKSAKDKLERDRLLQFLSNLLRVKGNVKLFIDCHGVPVLIDLLTLAHLHHDRAQLKTQTNVIEMNHEEKLGSEPEWYWQDENGEQQGPISYDTVEEMFKESKITKETRMWAQGLDAWHAFEDIPQLKWNLLYSSAGCLNPTELSCLVLDMLIRMCAFYPTRNIDGIIVRPVPRIKRMLAEPTVLPHIAQIMLTLDPGLVNRCASLLCELMEDNPHSSARLYLTGVFFFSLMYMGSDIKPICKLFHLCHENQAFRSDEGTSVLSPMLPKAMVCFLSNYGVDKFAEVFLGEFDNPEAIWGNEMRQHLVQKIAVHLMEFSPKLRSNTRAIYTYCPITPVVYAQLENELFCNIYYLRHLCDATRFPDWPIVKQVELLKDTLNEWRKEMDKKGNPVGLTRSKAFEALDLDPEVEHEASKVRKAYFVLAAQFHPDKNPDGRERFEEILKAYEYLANPNQPSDFPDPKRIDLLIRTQSILYKRFRDILSPYKYAGYPMLLSHVEKEATDPQLFALETPLLPSAAELCLHTVNASPLNAEELLREGGLELLKTALERCIDVIGDNSTDSDMPVLIAQRVIETFAVAADFESCRTRMQEMPTIVDMVCKGVTCKSAPRLAKASIACCSAFAAGETLQDQLYHAGVLWHLLLFVFGYDYTLDEGGVEKDAETNIQELKNIQSKAAIFTICRLCGFMENTKPHQAFTETLATLLTPYVVTKLKAECHNELPEGEPTVLKLLNSNSETPYMLWNNGTRAELTEFLTKAQEAALKGESFEDQFAYSEHQKELFVGGVFVRLYNEQPHFVLEEPSEFITAALVFVEKELEKVTPLEDSEAIRRIGACMEAIRNVVTAVPSSVVACLSFYKMMFSVFNVGTEPVCSMTAETLNLCTQNHDAVVTISEQSVLTPLMVCMTRFRSCVVGLLQILLSLASSTKAVAEMLDKGAYILALYEFATTRVPDIREAACQLLGKMVTDKLHGPKIALRSSKILPGVFIETMKENASTAAMMFDASSENPELIWTPDMRDKCVETCKTLREDVVKGLLTDPSTVFRLPDTLGHAASVDELEIGGVYLQLYVKQPAWALRNPRKFLTALFDAYLDRILESPISEELVQLISKCLVCLLHAQPVLTDQVPQLGHIPKLFNDIGKLQPVSSQCSIHIVHQLALCRSVVESMGQTNCMQPILDFMQGPGIADDELGQAIETIERMMVRNNCEHGCIVKRALDCNLAAFLLNVLDTNSSSAVRAVAVKALKAMSNGSSPNCQIVREQLSQHPKWDSYQSQNHDLFLTKETFAGYLTGPSKGPVLSLTSGPATSTSAAHSLAPPPINDAASAAEAAKKPDPVATALSGVPPSSPKKPEEPKVVAETPKAAVVVPAPAPSAEPKTEAPAEKPKEEAPKADEPKTAEAPTSEEREIENSTPAQEEPNMEEVKAEEPKVETLKPVEPEVEAPQQVEEPKEEPKAVEEPKVEPKAEEPKANEPKAEIPKPAEEVKAEEPKVEEPKAEEPKVEEPKVEEPKVEEPESKVEEPKAEEPKVEEPKVEEPKVEEPKVEEPKVEAPEPVEEVKAEDESTPPVVPEVEVPKVEEPVPEEPKAEEVETEEPKAEASSETE
eukprot:TRINITY_DN5388_c1_g1_i1.p1 TRINITY_DN5388_c1_g1~~TRINITY_DN5388_c1_g1_i1.p1  ORF type:complete len:2479 (+),score=758.14 TRINITY_DN5388_c1_g1_i1:52-7488(+)